LFSVKTFTRLVRDRLGPATPTSWSVTIEMFA
jgi:hypothetical protein